MWRIALALVVLLTACSGGDKKVIDVLRGVEITARVSTIVLQSDTLIVSDVLSVEGDDQPSLTQYACDGRRCTREAQTGTPLIEPLRELADLSIDPNTNYREIGKHRGVDLAQYSVTSTQNGVEWTFANYGAWLTHSAFETTIGNATRTGGIVLNTAYSVSFGDDTGTNPEGEGEGVWRGVMLGNTRHGPIQALRGDATLRFTFATDKLAVQFSNIRNLATNAQHPDMKWPDFDVADGAFEFQNPAGHVVGRFYGPEHAEVGGVFTHPTALGAFGAKK